MKKTNQPLQHRRYPVSGAGLGLRHDLMAELQADPPEQVDFMEIAPRTGSGSAGHAARRCAVSASVTPWFAMGCLFLSVVRPRWTISFCWT